MRFGQIIKHARAYRKIKQKDLAEMAFGDKKDAKVRVCKYENDVIQPSEESLFMLFNALGISVKVKTVIEIHYEKSNKEQPCYQETFEIIDIEETSHESI